MSALTPLPGVKRHQPSRSTTRACTHKIANGDSYLINAPGVHFAGLSQAFPKVREVPTIGLMRIAIRSPCQRVPVILREP